MASNSKSTDHGWSWCVLLASFTNQLLYSGTVPLVGMYIVEWQEYFEIGTGSLSIIATELSCGLHVIAVFVGAMCQRYGCRPVMVCGASIGVISTMLASFSTQLWHLHVCSIIGGLAYGAASFPSVIAIRFYFKKRLGFANGVTFAGIGAGYLVMSPLLEKLFSEYGWKGAMLIHAAINGNFIICGMVLRRTMIEQKIMTAYRSKTTTATLQDPNANDPHTESFCRRTLRNIDRTFVISKLVRNVHFITLCLVSILSLGSHVSVVVFTAPKLVLELGFSKATASLVISTYGITGLLSRAFHGLLLDFKLISVTNLFTLSLVIAGIQPILTPLVTSTAGQFALMVVYGLGAGIMLPMTMLVCRKYVALDIVPSAIGLLITVGGLGNILGTQLMGQLSEATGSYDIPFYLCGAFYWSSATVMVLISKCKRFPDVSQDTTESVQEADATPNSHNEDICKDTVSKTATSNDYHQVSGELEPESAV